MNFTVWIVQPPEDVNGHWRGLCEVARGIHRSLLRLGHTSIYEPAAGPPSLLPPNGFIGRPIVFNAHRLPADVELPRNSIIFNSEQVGTAFPLPYQALLRKHLIWDYSDLNRDRLRAYGVERTLLCHVGYYPELTDIEPVEEDIDVLFIGSLNERRKAILRDISLRVKAHHLFGIYGEERNQWIARAKVVLNLHYYEQPIFEIFRVSHLVANKKCVVSEMGGTDPWLEKLAESITCPSTVMGLPSRCSDLVDVSCNRKAVAQNGYEIFKGIDQAEEVRLALEAS
jgi:hypothetical protein